MVDWWADTMAEKTAATLDANLAAQRAARSAADSVDVWVAETAVKRAGQSADPSVRWTAAL
jgi:hypothetical protein